MFTVEDKGKKFHYDETNKANALYRTWKDMSQDNRDKIATVILMSGCLQAALIYGSISMAAVRRYHPSVKHREGVNNVISIIDFFDICK
jgi:predicted RND superfamily exporter protein